MSSSKRSSRTADKLPTKWKDLNLTLHGLYGYSPDLTLHPNHHFHLAQIDDILSLESTTDHELINGWKNKINQLIVAQPDIDSPENAPTAKKKAPSSRKRKANPIVEEVFLEGLPLPEEWESLNGHLHKMYGYGPNFNLVPEHEQHLAELRQFINTDHPFKDLLQNWVENIESTKQDIAKIMHEDQCNPKFGLPDSPKCEQQEFYPTPEKEKVVKQKKKQSTSVPQTQQLYESKKGYDFDFQTIANKHQFSTNLKNVKWVPQQSGKVMELQNENGSAAQVILFGRINRSLVGIYGDFNPLYHKNLLEGGNRWLTLKLIPVDGMVDEFVKQVDALLKIENTINPKFEESAQKFRAVKGPQEIQISRKLIAPVKGPNSFAPDDEDGIF